MYFIIKSVLNDIAVESKWLLRRNLHESESHMYHDPSDLLKQFTDICYILGRWDMGMDFVAGRLVMVGDVISLSSINRRERESITV